MKILTVYNTCGIHKDNTAHYIKTINDILEQTTGVESQKQFSEAQAKLRGKKGKYRSIIPPSAQDFMGLLYNFMGKGKVGEQQM